MSMRDRHSFQSPAYPAVGDKPELRLSPVRFVCAWTMHHGAMLLRRFLPIWPVSNGILYIKGMENLELLEFNRIQEHCERWRSSIHILSDRVLHTNLSWSRFC